jgi:hypothetical protein
MKNCIAFVVLLLFPFFPLPANDVSAVFQPEFIAIHSPESVIMTSVKWTKPIYNLVGWKRGDGTTELDVFEVADVITLQHPSIEQRGDAIHWQFKHDAIKFEAELSQGKLRYTFTAKKPGMSRVKSAVFATDAKTHSRLSTRPWRICLNTCSESRAILSQRIRLFIIRTLLAR